MTVKREPPDLDAYALEIGRLAMQAARMEQLVHDLLWMMMGYEVGAVLTKGKRLAAICDLVRDLIATRDEVPEEVRKSVQDAVSEARACGDTRNDIIHRSYMLTASSSAQGYEDEPVTFSYTKKGVVVQPAELAEIRDATERIWAAAGGLRRALFDDLLPIFHPAAAEPHTEPFSSD